MHNTLVSLCSRAVLAGAFLFSLSAAAANHTVTYPADNHADFANPERGFYEMVEVHFDGNGGGQIGDWAFTEGAAANRSLILRHYYMERYNDGTPISQADLQLISNDLARYRQKGFKAIIRFSYGDSYTDDTHFCHDATEAHMLAHMAQLKPVLAANADVIYVVQAGFVGVWGEWYYSYQFGIDCNNNTAQRNRIIAGLLDMVPADRAVQMRTPQYIAEYVGNGTANYNAPLTAATAFNGSVQSRLGHHNDAFCNGAENLGTYRNINTQKPYLAQTGMYVPMGGETCLGTWDAGYQQTYTNYNTGAKSAADMQLLHYDYMNFSYSQYVTDQWKTEMSGGESWYSIISRSLGYRYELRSATLPDSVAPGGVLPLALTIRNNGYSTLYNERHAYLVLRNGTKVYRLQLQSDPRFWVPGTADVQVTENLTLPADLPAGTYQLSLALPDAYASLAGKPAYAVRFANPGLWNATTGENSLMAQVVVSSSAPAQPEPDDPVVTPTQPATLRVDLGTAVRPLDESTTSSWTLSADSILTVNYSTSGEWGYTGVAFPIDNRRDILSVSFDYRGNATTPWVVVQPFLWDGAYRWTDGVDYEIMDNTWHTATMVPSEALWEDNPASAYRQLPVSLLGFYANPMDPTTASFSIRNVVLHLDVPAGPATALTEPAAKPRAEKQLRDGRLLILIDGTCYDAQGRRVE